MRKNVKNNSEIQNLDRPRAFKGSLGTNERPVEFVQSCRDGSFAIPSGFALVCPTARPRARPPDRPSDGAYVLPCVRPSVRPSDCPSVRSSDRPNDIQIMPNRPFARPSVRPFVRSSFRPFVRS